MYADGDGVVKDKARAFEYFRQLTNHPQADDSVGTPQARFVANAFVSLGQYYLEGIPNVVAPDPAVAHQMFRYAASYFADSGRAVQFGPLYLNGRGAPKDAIQAARWLRLAANKGDHRAQALLGAMLFKGQEVSRQGGARIVLADRRQGQRRRGRELDHRYLQNRVRAGHRRGARAGL